jgi:DNA-nicking Smr family endonuclease
MVKNRDLTPEEKELWSLVTKSTRPLSKSAKKKEKAEKKPQAAIIKKYRSAASTFKKPEKASPLMQGGYAGIDGNTAERFRKGKYTIDGTLDLHGMTEKNAHAALLRFIEAHFERKNRCLLIITGKGTLGKGILKQALPDWLMSDALSPVVLTFDKAQARHGGSGAYYVLLRRQR